MLNKLVNLKKGQITVFLSLILVLVFSLVFTLLESVRYKGLKFRLELASEAGIASAFAMYDKTLWENYGLLFFADRYGNGVEFEDIFQEYGELNAATTSGPGEDWFALRNFQPSVSRFAQATDENGKVFIKAVSTYMKEAGLAKATLDLYEGFDSAEEDISGFDMLDDEGSLNLWSMKSNLDSISDSLSEAENSQEEIEPIEVQGDPKAADEIYSSLSNNLKNYIEKGFLALVCDTDNISSTPFFTKHFPSNLDDYYKNRVGISVENITLIDKVLFREYLMIKLNNYSKDKEKTLELEYLIGGKDSDLDNLSYVVGALIGIRCVYNFIFLNTTKRFRDEAYAVAALVTGWTGSEVIVRLTQELLLLIWATAESVVDVKNLLSGKEIPLAKGEKDWNLSLEGAAKGGVSETRDSKGLTYKDYLRLLLYMGNPEKMSYRAMDMIQMKIQETEPDFYMKNCIYEARITASSVSNELFPYLPGEIYYNLETDVSFSYGYTD